LSVRPLRVSHTHVTGYVAREGQSPIPFTSLVEKDFLTLLLFDRSVEQITAQPVTLKNTSDTDKSWRQYTPDYFVTWKPGTPRKPWLVEVKPTEDLRKDWAIWRKKFAAGCGYARSTGAIFKVFTDKKIRTPALARATFLTPYRSLPRDSVVIEQVLKWYERVSHGSPDACFAALGISSADQPATLSQVWHLLATGALRMGDDRAINRFTELSIAPAVSASGLS
jgi:hypothetical protein